MPDGIRWVGLDVHARESTLAVFDQATGEVITKRVVGRPHELLPLLRGIPRAARMVYEAGPTGYGLARRALANSALSIRADEAEEAWRVLTPVVEGWSRHLPPLQEYDAGSDAATLKPGGSNSPRAGPHALLALPEASDRPRGSSRAPAGLRAGEGA
jgi:Glucose-6-phosphate dehydrogenase, C-terminal domain